MITDWDIVISGFTQSIARPTGPEIVWQKIHQLAAPGRVVLLYPWNSSWSEIAEYIWRQSIQDSTQPTRVRIYAYSWGGGYGFPVLSRELAKRGVGVEAAVLCDPVYRTLWLPTWFVVAPLSMTRWLPGTVGWPRVTVPANVGEVYHFFQRQNRPCGHPVVAKNPDVTTVHPGVEIKHRTHQYIDDAPEWVDLCYRIAKEPEDGNVSLESAC